MGLPSFVMSVLDPNRLLKHYCVSISIASLHALTSTISLRILVPNKKEFRKFAAVVRFLWERLTGSTFYMVRALDYRKGFHLVLVVNWNY